MYVSLLPNREVTLMADLGRIVLSMMTSSNGNIFRVTGHCPFVRGIHRSPGEFPAQRPVTRSFDVFFDLNKQLSKQSWGWWFETLWRPLWRHCNDSGHQSSVYRWRTDVVRTWKINIILNMGWNYHLYRHMWTLESTLQKSNMTFRHPQSDLICFAGFTLRQ